MALEDDIVSVVDFITRLPGDVARVADEGNDRLISFFQDLESAMGTSAPIIEENLKRNKIQSLGRRFADWISQPVNLVVTGVGFFVILILTILLSRRI